MINRFKNIEIKKVLIILVIILFAFSALFSLSSNDKIAILEIEGVIKNPKQYLESMRDISEDDSIKGLIVRIDSPGGTVGSSQEIHESLIKLSNKMGPGKNIVTILCDHGKRYASKIFNKDFLKSKNLPIPKWL